jgi:hypothetical protein
METSGREMHFLYLGGLLLRHDSAARKATVKWMTRGDLFVLPGALGHLASSTKAW